MPGSQAACSLRPTTPQPQLEGGQQSVTFKELLATNQGLMGWIAGLDVKNEGVQAKWPHQKTAGISPVPMGYHFSHWNILYLFLDKPKLDTVGCISNYIPSVIPMIYPIVVPMAQFYGILFILMGGYTSGVAKNGMGYILILWLGCYAMKLDTIVSHYHSMRRLYYICHHNYDIPLYWH